MGALVRSERGGGVPRKAYESVQGEGGSSKSLRALM